LRAESRPEAMGYGADRIRIWIELLSVGRIEPRDPGAQGMANLRRKDERGWQAG